MKILGFAGSPRKNGNSTLLLREALNAARQEGAETELIHLVDKDIRHCEGCWSCNKTGRCKIKDDMQEFYDKLEAADGVIVASPTYVGAVTSTCQAFLERTVCLLQMRMEGDRLSHVGKSSSLSGKAGGAIVTGRRRGVQGPLDALNFFFLMHRMVLVHAGVAGFSQSMKPGGIAEEDKPAVAMAAELGRVVVAEIKSRAAARALA